MQQEIQRYPEYRNFASAWEFGFARQTLSVSKTWDYKGEGGFLPTKNKSSVRKIQIDWQIVVKFSELVKMLPESKLVLIEDYIDNIIKKTKTCATNLEKFSICGI